MKVNIKLRSFNTIVYFFLFLIFIYYILELRKNEWYNQNTIGGFQIEKKHVRNRTHHRAKPLQNFHRYFRNVSSLVNSSPFRLRCQMNSLQEQDDDMKTEYFLSEYRLSSCRPDKWITRAILLHYDAYRIDYFRTEFKSFFRSWIEMQRHEPLNIQTDIIFFTDCGKVEKDVEDFKCLVHVKDMQLPMRTTTTKKKRRGNCYCIPYKSLQGRKAPTRNTLIITNYDYTKQEAFEFLKTKIEMRNVSYQI
ncbi:hypothetical protein SNEBB_002838 [Seison nebaliae]|nr:hypothetical protein SNEBB_002838 [Seison nebaliae]